MARKTLGEYLEEACRFGDEASRADTPAQVELLLGLMAAWLEIAKREALRESSKPVRLKDE